MSLTGNYMDAAEALAVGLVNRIVAHDELLPTALALGRDIVSNDAEGVATLLASYKETALDDCRRRPADRAPHLTRLARAPVRPGRGRAAPGLGWQEGRPGVLRPAGCPGAWRGATGPRRCAGAACQRAQRAPSAPPVTGGAPGA